MTKKVYAYDKATGSKRLIPSGWLDHPHAQFQKFSKTPRQRKAERDKNPAPEPVTKTPAKGTDNTESGD